MMPHPIHRTHAGGAQGRALALGLHAQAREHGGPGSTLGWVRLAAGILAIVDHAMVPRPPTGPEPESTGCVHHDVLVAPYSWHLAVRLLLRSGSFATLPVERQRQHVTPVEVS